MLGYNLQSRNATLVNVAETKVKISTGPFLDSFTRFRRQPASTDDDAASDAEQPDEAEPGTGGGSSGFHGIDDALWVDDNSLFDHRARRRQAMESRRYSNIHGPIPAGGDYVPEAIVDILGNASKSGTFRGGQSS